MKTHNKLRLISLFLGLVNPSLKSLKNLLFSLSFVLIVQPLLANSGIHSVSIGLEPSQINLFQDLAISSQEQEYIETLTLTQQSEYKALSVGNQKAQVLNWLVDSERRENNEKPRLEMRMCFGHEEMYANIALCCKDSGAREVVFPFLKNQNLQSHFI